MKLRDRCVPYYLSCVIAALSLVFFTGAGRVALAMEFPAADHSFTYADPDNASGPDETSGGEEIWIDADTIQALLAQVREHLGPDFQELHDQVSGARMVQKKRGSGLWVYLKRAVRLRLDLVREGESPIGRPYELLLPKTLFLDLKYSGSKIHVRASRNPWRRIGIKVQLPLSPDLVEFRSLSLDFEKEEAQVLAYAFYSAITVVASARFEEGKPVVGLDILETIIRNLDVLSPWRFMPYR